MTPGTNRRATARKIAAALLALTLLLSLMPGAAFAEGTAVKRPTLVNMLCARFFGVTNNEAVSAAIDTYITLMPDFSLDTKPFNDVDAEEIGEFHCKVVAFAKAMGWVQGDAEGNFGPNETMTGAEAAALTAKALKSKVRINGDVTSHATWAKLGVDTYADVDAININQAESIMTAVQNGLVTPTIGTSFYSGALELSWMKIAASAGPAIELKVYAVDVNASPNTPSRALVLTGATSEALPVDNSYWYMAGFSIPALNPSVGTARYEIDVLGPDGEALYTAPSDRELIVKNTDDDGNAGISAYVNEAVYYTLVKELRIHGSFPVGEYSLQIGNQNRAVSITESKDLIFFNINDASTVGNQFVLTPWSLGKAPAFGESEFTPEITRYAPVVVSGKASVGENTDVFDNVLDMTAFQPFRIATNPDGSFDPINSNCDPAFFDAMRDAGVIDANGDTTTEFQGARFYGFFNAAYETFPVVNEIPGYTKVSALDDLDPEKAVYYGFKAGDFNYMLVLKHTWVVTSSTPPTCEDAGSIVYECAEHGLTRTVTIPALGHDYRGVYTAPTCETKGSYQMVCAHDSTHTLPGASIPALGHDWGDWTVVTPADVGVEGQEKRVCRRDPSHVETRVIPAKVADKFSVTYISGIDGILLGSESVTSGESANPPPLAAVSGYTFTGWKRSDGKSVSAPITALTVFTATYTKLEEKFTVTFVAPSGAGDALEAIGEPQEISKGFVAKPPTPPAIAGKRFVKWDKDFDTNGKTFTVTSNMTIEAKYEDTPYYSIVYLDLWGFYSGSELVASGGSGTRVAAEIPGYKFVGWYPSVENVTESISTRPLYMFDTDAWLAAWNWGLTATDLTATGQGNTLSKPDANNSNTANFWGFVYDGALYVDRAVTLTGIPATSGDVYLNYSGIHTDGLKLNSNNTLVITDKVGDGEVWIKGFSGNLRVEGGGAHSVHIADSSIDKLTVDKAQDSGAEPVSIKADGDTTLASVDVQSPVKLEPETVGDLPTITAVTVNTTQASDVVEISTAVATLAFETSGTVALSAPVDTVSVGAGAAAATVAAVDNNATVGSVTADSSVKDSITLVGNDNLETAAETVTETFTVTATAGKNGSVTPTSASVESGKSVVFTFEPVAGYEVDKITEGATTLQSGGVSYTLTNVTANHDITVTFKAESDDDGDDDDDDTPPAPPAPPLVSGPSGGGGSTDKDKAKDTAKEDSVSGATADTSSLPEELKNLKVQFAEVETSSLPSEIQTMVKAGALAFEITATADGAAASDLKGGVVSVSVPFKAPDGVKASKVAAFHLNGGKLEPVNGKFDPVSGKITLKLRHFSTYVISVNDVKYTAGGGWYDADDLDFAVQRGLFDKFIVGGKVDAGAGITRGEFIVAIMKSLGVAPHTEFETTFTDVSGADAAYLNTAKALGIVQGTNDAGTLFEPNRAATRGEQFRIMYNLITAKLVTPQASGGAKTLADFEDGASVPEWLKPALSALLKSGVVRGDGRNLLVNDAFTLGQAASVIERMR